VIIITTNVCCKGMLVLYKPGAVQRFDRSFMSSVSERQWLGWSDHGQNI
jgi:hypothetical protein